MGGSESCETEQKDDSNPDRGSQQLAPKPRPDLSDSDEQSVGRCHEILAAVSQGECITEQVLQAYMELPARLHGAIWSRYCLANTFPRQVFLQLLRDACSPRARSGRFLFSVYRTEADIVTGSELSAMLEDELELAKAAMADLGRERLGGPKSEGRVFSAFVNKVPAEGLNENQFATWADRELPELGALLSAWLMGKVRRCEDELKQQMGAAGEGEEASTAQGAVLEMDILANYMPLTEGQSGVMDSEALWGLGRIWPKTQQAAMKRLYSTDDNGCNLIMMARAINGYKGPTLIVMRDKPGKIFGGFAQQMWKDTGQFVTDPDSFLFRIDQNLAAFGSQGGRNNLLLATYGKKKGFGFGGTLQAPRLFIDHGLREGDQRSMNESSTTVFRTICEQLYLTGEWRNGCKSYENDPETYGAAKVDIWALEVTQLWSACDIHFWF